MNLESNELLKPSVIIALFLSAATSRKLLLQCLWGLFSENPYNSVERKANQWIRV